MFWLLVSVTRSANYQNLKSQILGRTYYPGTNLLPITRMLIIECINKKNSKQSSMWQACINCHRILLHCNTNISTVSYHSHAQVCKGQSDRQTEATYYFHSNVCFLIVDMPKMLWYPLVIGTQVTGYKIFTYPSKKISNDQELIQSDPTSCPQNQKGNN